MAVPIAPQQKWRSFQVWWWPSWAFSMRAWGPARPPSWWGTPAKPRRIVFRRIGSKNIQKPSKTYKQNQKPEVLMNIFWSKLKFDSNICCQKKSERCFGCFWRWRAMTCSNWWTGSLWSKVWNQQVRHLTSLLDMGFTGEPATNEKHSQYPPPKKLHSLVLYSLAVTSFSKAFKNS